jgi:uncharacterized membrane protein
MSLSIVLPLRNQSDLTSLLQRLYDPTSPDYHHFLSVEQFTDRFGPTADDYQAVVAFAQANGFTVTGTPTNRLIVPISGSAAQVNRAFHVTMQVYQHPTEDRTFFSPDREPTLNLSVPVIHISGLNNYAMPQPRVRRTTVQGQATPYLSITGSGPNGAYLGSDMRAAYYGGTVLTGSGQTVGLLEFGGYNLSDVNATFSNAGQTYNVPINNVLLDGATGAPVGDDAEQVLDIVQAIGMAPGLSQVRVYIGNGSGAVDDPNIFNSMATENIAKQISVSWGWRPDDPAVDDVFFQEFAAQGQTLFAASGDDGAFDYSISPYFYPGEDAYVTAVGATHLTTTGAAGPWASETAWNSQGAGSGGGISPDGIGIPSWQAGLATVANGGSATLRNVPDVAMEGDFDNYSCSVNSGCSSGWAGTSFAAPRWAGFMALVNQQAIEAGNAPQGGIGQINPSLYAIAAGTGYAKDLHDTIVGNNDTENQPVYFNAVPGYDLVTGLGSPTGQPLIDALAGPQVPGFWLSSSSGTLGIMPGGTGSATITVLDAGGFSDKVTLAVTSALPSGVTAAWSTNPTSGTSVLTLSATSSATGTATVTVTGTSGSLTASISVLVAVHTPGFTLSASAGAVSIGQGASGASTITVTPQYGFSGSVNLAVTGLPSGVTASWSANPTTGTSVLTLSASASTAIGSSTLTITGTSGTLTATTTLRLGVFGPSFSLSTSSSLNIGQGMSVSSTVYVTPSYGFSGSVNLSVSGLPSGVTAFFSSNPVSSTAGYSILTLQASTTASVGNATLTITGTSGNLTMTTTMVVGVFAPSFTVSASSVNLGQGNSNTSYVYVSPQYGFNGVVNLAVTGLPAGVTASFSPPATTAYSTLTLKASGSALPGNSTLTITGTSGGITASTTIILGVYVPTFVLSGSSLSVGQGNSGATSVSITPEYGFNGSVNLAVSGLPSGVTASFSPNPSTGSSTLTFYASGAAAAGNTLITVTGTSGTLSAFTTLTLGIYPPGFTVSASNVNIGQGSSGSASVSVNPRYGFTGSVNLSVSGLPSGVTASFTPNPTTGSSALTLTAGSTAALGSSTLTITGTSGTLTASSTLILGIYQPSFTLSAGSVAVGQGSSGSSSVYVTPQYGFTGSVSLAVTSLPAGITATFSPNPTIGTSVLTITASSTAATGNTTLTITGTYGSVTATTSLPLSVSAPSFSMSAGNVSIGQGSSGSSYVYVSPLSGFNGVVNLAVTGLPTGVTASFSANPVVSNTTLNLAAGSATAPGQYTVTVTGTSGSLSASTSFTLSVSPQSFSISANALNLGQGGSGSTPVSVGSQSGFTGGVNLALSGLPTGVTASFGLNPVISSTTLAMAVARTVAAGQYPVTVTGTSGSLTASTTFVLTVSTQSFTLSSSGSISVGQGASGASYVTISSQSSFTGSVNLAVSGLPAGVTGTWSVNPAVGSSTLVLAATSTAAVGSTVLTITGTSGGLSASTTLTLSVYPPSFTLSGGGSLILSQGGTGTSYIDITPLYGFTGKVALAVSGLPSGVTASFSPNPSTGSSSLLTLTASSAATLGQYNVIVTGTFGSTVATVPLNLTVIAPSFSLSSNGVSVGQGTSATTYVSISSQTGFTGSVNLAVSGLPSGVTASFSPNPTTGSSTLTLTASSTATLGQYNATVTGTSGSLTATAILTVGVYAPTFTLSSYLGVSLGQGGSGTSYIYLNSLYGFAGSVNLSIAGLPSGVTASFSPNPTSSYSTTVTFTASSTAALGQYTVLVSGSSPGAKTATTALVVTVAPASFTLFANSISISPGYSSTGSVSINSQSGSIGNVTLAASGLPAGVTASFSPNPISSGYSTITLAATSAASVGQYNITITGTSGSVTASTTLSLGVYAPTFTLSSSSVSVGQGSSSTSFISVSPLYGFTGSVNLSVTGLPAGVTATLSPNPITGYASSTVTVTASATAALGQYAATITGVSGGAIFTAPFVVSVYPPSFTLSNYGGVTISQGASGTATIYVTSLYGFAGSVSLAVSGLPTGVTASFSSNPVATGYNSVLTLTAANPSASGAANIVITGTSGSSTASTTLLLVVNPETFSIAIAPSQVSLHPGSSVRSAIYVVPQNGFTGSVNLSVSGLPSGVTGSFTPNPETGSSTFTLTADGTAALGTTPITVSGTSGIYTANANLVLVVAATPSATSTTLAVASGGTPVTSIAAGSLVTLTAAVSGGTPPVTTGQVRFCDATAAFCEDGALLGTAQLTSAGTATLKFIPAMGIRSYKAVFAGTNTNATSVSTASGLTVTAAIASSTTIVQGGVAGNYTLTATVTAPGVVSPTGNVSFLDTSSANSLVGAAGLQPHSLTQSWVTTQTKATGSQPLGVASGDFNGDGIPDLAVTNYSSNSVTILLGNADGTLTASSVSPPTGGSPYGIAAADFNGDGKTDLAVANTAGGTLTILLGNGDGTFAVASSPSAGYLPQSLVTADFNGDGIVDLAVGSQYSNAVTILLGNGDGTFTAASSLVNSYYGPQSLAVADFNGDGIADLAWANENGNTVIIFLGNGDGTFTLGSGSPQTGSYPYSVVAGDYNGDGIPDLATANYGANTVTLLLGVGDGTFRSIASPSVVLSEPTALVNGDFNGDGKLDLAVMNYANGVVSILQGNGDGTFAAQATLQTGNTYANHAATVSNWNGYPGLAVTNQQSNTVIIFASQLTQTATATATGVSPLGQGVHQIDASYPGDTSYASSVSQKVALTAQPGTPTVLVTLSQMGTTAMQALPVTIAVAYGTGNPNPTGSVILSSGGYTSAATPLIAGSAVITVPAGALTTGPHTLTASYAPDATSASLYNSSTGSTSVTISKATPSILWPTPASIVYGTALSAAQLNATSSVAGSFSYSPTLGVNLSAGTQTLTVTFTPNDTTNYTTATASVTLTVSQNTPVITWPTPAAIVYGTALTATQLNATSTVIGTFSYSPALGANLNAGPQTLTVTFTPNDSTDFTTATASVVLTVNKVSPAITWAAPSAIGYGTPLTVSQLNAASTVAGSFSYSPALGATLSAGPQTLSVTFTPTDTSDYANATATVSLTVNKAVPTIVWPSPLSITYGTSLSAAQLDATSTVAGSFSYSPSLGTTPTAGSQTLSVTFTPTDTADYSASTANVILLVNRAVPVITWATPMSITYGTSLSTAQLNATAIVAGSFSYSPALGATLNAGPQTLSTTFTPTDTSDYSAATAVVSLTVSKATPAVVLTPSSTNITTLQPLTVTIAISGGSSFTSIPSGTLRLIGGGYTSAATTLTGGSVAISIPAGALATGTDTLTATYTPDTASSSAYNGVSGSSSVSVSTASAGLALVASPAAATYGQQVQLTATLMPAASQSTAANGETVTFYSGGAILGTGTLSSGVAMLSLSTLPIGTDILTAVYAGDSTFAPGTSSALAYAVQAIAPAISFSIPNHTYGDGPFAVAAVSNSPSPIIYSVLSGPATVAGMSVTLTGAGIVVLQASQPATGNYAAGTQTASFTVASETPTIVFSAPNHTFGDAPFAVSANSNSTGAFTYSVDSGPATINGSTVTLTGAGTVVLRATEAAAGNYSVAALTATFSVASSSQTIAFAAPSASISYGTAPIVLSASASSGLAVTFSVLSGPATLSGSSLTITGAGTIVIAADQPGNANYSAAIEVTRSIQVNKATPSGSLTTTANPVLLQGVVTFTATVASPIGTPTGSVVFSDSGTALGPGNLTGGMATLSLSTLATGSHTITATYSGDANFASVTTATVMETVEDFTLSPTGSGTSSQTVAPGATATYTISLTLAGGATLPTAVNFSAFGIPAGATATFNPASLPAGSSATGTTLSVQTPLTAGLDRRSFDRNGLAVVAMGLLLLPFTRKSRRITRPMRRTMLAVLSLAFVGGLAGITGCGGGSSGGGSTQPQTYSITVTATSGSLSHSTNVSLTVQ